MIFFCHHIALNARLCALKCVWRVLQEILYSASALQNTALQFVAHPSKVRSSSGSIKSKKPVTRMGNRFFGTAEGIRTPDLLVRSQTLYPAELQPQIVPSVDDFDRIPYLTQKSNRKFKFFQKTFLPAFHGTGSSSSRREPIILTSYISCIFKHQTILHCAFIIFAYFISRFFIL